MGKCKMKMGHRSDIEAKSELKLKLDAASDFASSESSWPVSLPRHVHKVYIQCSICAGVSCLGPAFTDGTTLWSLYPYKRVNDALRTAEYISIFSLEA